MRMVLFIILFVKCQGKSKQTKHGCNPDDHPFLVKVEISYTLDAKIRCTHLCSAAALTTTWTLTAGHCIKNTSNTLLGIHQKYPTSNPVAIIRYGPPKQKNQSEILDGIVHPSFFAAMLPDASDGTVRNDVGLLKNKPIFILSYGRISVVDPFGLLGQKAKITGFGVSKTGIPNTKNIRMFEIAVGTCDSDMSKKVFPAMCVAEKCNQRKRKFKGDPGAPLLHVTGIIGINSVTFTYKIEDDDEKVRFNMVSAVTAISPYVDWILAHISEVPIVNTTTPANMNKIAG